MIYKDIQYESYHLEKNIKRKRQHEWWWCQGMCENTLIEFVASSVVHNTHVDVDGWMCTSVHGP